MRKLAGIDVCECMGSYMHLLCMLCILRIQRKWYRACTYIYMQNIYSRQYIFYMFHVFMWVCICQCALLSYLDHQNQLGGSTGGLSVHGMNQHLGILMRLIQVKSYTIRRELGHHLNSFHALPLMCHWHPKNFAS